MTQSDKSTEDMVRRHASSPTRSFDRASAASRGSTARGARPLAGVGLGLRGEFARQLLDAGDAPVDFLEIVPESWMGCGGERRRLLAECRERWPVVPHSISMSLGGVDPIDHAFVSEARAFARDLGAPFWSDHIACAKLAGAYARDLLPVPFSWEAVENIVRRTKETRAAIELPLVLEHPTYYVKLPGSDLSESSFLNAVLAETDAGFLLDVNNVYVNSQNHGFDPYLFIDTLPLERVAQVHLAGHTRSEKWLIDTHSQHVSRQVCQLYEHTLSRAGRMLPTLIEWDYDLPSLATLLEEVQNVRRHAHAALGVLATEAA